MPSRDWKPRGEVWFGVLSLAIQATDGTRQHKDERNIARDQVLQWDLRNPGGGEECRNEDGS